MHEISKLLEMKTSEVATHIINEFKRLDIAYTYGWKDDLMYIYAPSKAHKTMLVAHIDTVDATPPKVKQAGQLLYSASPGKVLGADDRAGVYGILKIVEDRKVKNKPLPSILFTNYEEKGGIGVAYFCKNEVISKDDVHFMIELDRQGKDDWVAYQINDNQVDDYVESFGFKEEFGCYSDIADLSEAFEIPSVNLSIGYKHQHTQRETLNIDWMNKTINRVQNMLDKPIKKCYGVSSSVYSGSNYLKGDWWKPAHQPHTQKHSLWDWEDADKAEKVLATVTNGNLCWLCNAKWHACTCGTVADTLYKNLTYLELEYIMESLLEEDDKVYFDLLKMEGSYEF